MECKRDNAQCPLSSSVIEYSEEAEVTTDDSTEVENSSALPPLTKTK
jgi:hypothetical protein